jgi:ketosteroid isomerase-like protein
VFNVSAGHVVSDTIVREIQESEDQLRLAMLQSDVAALNRLLAPELIFTNHLGQVLTKQADLEAHASGTIALEVLTPSDFRIQVLGDVAVVSVRMQVAGSYAGSRSEGCLRFTRVWVRSANGAWWVVAGHSSVVQ